MKTWLTIFSVLFISLFSVAFTYAQFEKQNYSNVSKHLYQTEMKVTNSALRPDLLLDSLIRVTMSEHKIPGLASCIVKDGQIIWNKSYGYANIEQNKNVTDSTSFLFCSMLA